MRIDKWVGTIHVGDSERVACNVPKESISVSINDPPYFTGTERKGKDTSTHMATSYDDRRTYHLSVRNGSVPRWIRDLATENGVEDTALSMYLNKQFSILRAQKPILRQGASIFYILKGPVVSPMDIVLRKVFGSKNRVRKLIWKIEPTTGVSKGVRDSYYEILWFAVNIGNMKCHQMFYDKYTEGAYLKRDWDRGFFYLGNRPPEEVNGLIVPHIMVIDEELFKESRVKDILYTEGPYEYRLSSIPDRMTHRTKAVKKFGRAMPVAHDVVLNKSDIITNIKRVHRMSKENISRTPDQKPLELIGFLLAMTSDVGDVVIDCFAGSGTTAVQSYLMGRKFIYIDEMWEQAMVAKDRLLEVGGLPPHHEVRIYPWSHDGLLRLNPSGKGKDYLPSFEDWVRWYLDAPKLKKDMGIDGGVRGLNIPVQIKAIENPVGSRLIRDFRRSMGDHPEFDSPTIGIFVSRSGYKDSEVTPYVRNLLEDKGIRIELLQTEEERGLGGLFKCIFNTSYRMR